MKKNQEVSNGNYKRALERIKRYVKNVSKGQEFTVEDVCGVVRFNDHNFVENTLIGYAFYEKLGKKGSKFIKKDYSNKDISNLVLKEINLNGHFQPSIFLKLNRDVPEEKLSEIIEKICTEYRVVKKDEDGDIVYFRC